MGKLIVRVKQYGQNKGQLNIDLSRKGGESGVEQYRRIVAEFNAAADLNLNEAAIIDVTDPAKPKVKIKGPLVRIRELACPLVSGGYGPMPLDGKRASVAGYRPLLAETRLEDTLEYVNGVEEGATSVWHLEVPDAGKNDDMSWWPDHICEMFVQDDACTYAECDGKKVSVRHDAHKPGWLGFLNEWGFEVAPNAGGKIKKRLNVATRTMPQVAAFKRREVRIGLIKKPLREDFADDATFAAHLQTWKVVHDGALLFRKGFAAEVLRRQQQKLDMGPDYQRALEKYGGADSIPAQVVLEIALMRDRMLQERIERFLARPCGNARVLVGDYEEALLKGDYFNVEELKDDDGNEVDILLCAENQKKEIRGIHNAKDGEAWVLVGIEPGKVKRGTRTSTQKLINHRALFPSDQVGEWMEQEAIRLLEQITNGRLEEDSRLESERAEALERDLSEGTRSVQRRHREVFELAMGAGMSLRNLPTGSYNAFSSLIGRLAYRDIAKMNVAVPHSYSMHILPETLARRCGWVGIVMPGEIDISVKRGYAVITDADWEVAREDWGGSDHDDHYDMLLVKDSSHNGEYRVVVVRDPNDIGEYAIFTPTQRSLGEYLGKWEKVTGSSNKAGTVFTFKREELPVRTVDLGKMPVRMSERLRRGAAGEAGGTIIKEPVGISTSKVYPEGYTKKEVLADMHRAFTKEQPGFAVNVRMLVALLDVKLDIIPCRMEKIIDVFTQGGSSDAMNAINQKSEEFVERCIAYCLNNKGKVKIDRLFLNSKHFKVPEKYKNTDCDLYLTADGEGWLEQLFDKYEEVKAKYLGKLKNWLLFWQQPIPAWTRLCKKHPGAEARSRQLHPVWRKKAHDIFAELGRKAGEGAPRQVLDEIRDRYEAGVREFVSEYTVYPLMQKACFIKGDGDTAGLYQDDLLWNGCVGELVCDWLKGDVTDKGERLEERDPCLRAQRGMCVVDELTFRVACHDPHYVANWVRELDDGLLAGVMSLLQDHALLIAEMAHAEIPEEQLAARRKLVTPEKLKAVLAALGCDDTPPPPPSNDDNGPDDTPPTPTTPPTPEVKNEAERREALKEAYWKEWAEEKPAPAAEVDAETAAKREAIKAAYWKEWAEYQKESMLNA